LLSSRVSVSMTVIARFVHGTLLLSHPMVTYDCPTLWHSHEIKTKYILPWACLMSMSIASAESSLKHPKTSNWGPVKIGRPLFQLSPEKRLTTLISAVSHPYTMPLAFTCNTYCTART